MDKVGLTALVELTDYGFSTAKAIEIIFDAKRGDAYAKSICRTVYEARTALASKEPTT